MEEKKILTDEELDNVVGGLTARDAHHPESANIGLTSDKNKSLINDPVDYLRKKQISKTDPIKR